ncbi:MAG: hypothetical protein ABGZ37_00515, partial [Akkermansiaceae bacterium]
KEEIASVEKAMADFGKNRKSLQKAAEKKLADATKAAKAVEKEDDPIAAAMWRSHGKAPTEDERKMINKFLNEQIKSYGGKREPALVDFCHALLATNEMIYVE